MSLIQEFNNNDNAGENISLVNLNLSNDTMVKIQYLADFTKNVPISTLKLNLLAHNDGGR